MRHIIFTILFTSLLYPQSITTGVWKEKFITAAKIKYTLLDFSDSLNGCVFTGTGIYSTTTDGGKSWSDTSRLLTTTNITKVSYVNNVIFAVDELDYRIPIPINLHISTDKGQSWSVITLPDSVLQRGGMSISLVNEKVIGFISQDGYLIFSTNLGNTWDTMSVIKQNPFGDFVLFNIDNIVVSGGWGLPNTGYVRQSSDSGLTWKTIVDDNGLSLAFSEFYTTSLGYFVLGYGEDPTIYNTVFYNPILDMSIIESSGSFFGALFENGEYLKIGSASALVKAQADSSYYLGSWNPGNIKIKRFTLTSKENSWILSDSGRLFQRIDYLVHVNDIHSKLSPNEFRIVNFPNPFNPATKLSYRLPRSGVTRLTVYDLLGREVATLVDAHQPPGEYAVDFNGSGLSSGLYLYRLTSGEFTAQRTMMLLK